jgi:hypothetical protein
MREIFFTVDGGFGQLMIGKGLSLFMGQNLLTEQTLMGAGNLGSAIGLSDAVGVTLGRIGYGYLYPNFNAQVRYTTPDMGGIKAAIGIYDPATIGDDFDETKLPRVEGELSYAGTFGDGNIIKAYTNAMWQEVGAVSSSDDVTAWGVSAGAVVGLGGFELSGSAFTGEALGVTLMFGSDALDATGEEREMWGYIGQLTYTLANEGKTKFGVSYGVNEMDETSNDRTVRQGGGVPFIESLAMLTFMVTQDITPNLKLVGELSFLEHEWHNGADWNAEQISIGTFFLW